MLAELVGKKIGIESFWDGLSGRFEVLAYEDDMFKLQQVTRFLKTKPFWFPVRKIDKIVEAFRE